MLLPVGATHTLRPGNLGILCLLYRRGPCCAVKSLKKSGEAVALFYDEAVAVAAGYSRVTKVAVANATGTVVGFIAAFILFAGAFQQLWDGILGQFQPAFNMGILFLVSAWGVAVITAIYSRTAEVAKQ